MLIVVLLHLIPASLSLSTPSPNGCTQFSDSTRTVPSIVLSCLATIFACTWTSVHPNIPGDKNSGWKLYWEQVKIFIIALIAPELIAAWALIQYRCSRQTVRKLRGLFPNSCNNLTYTHGMFLVMGGFVLVDGLGGRVLQEPDIMNLLRNHQITFSGISKERIMDKSKADGLAKTVAMVQTIWFMTQVIARLVQHLPITELELTTAAFSSLNVLIYVLWWNKPKNVRYPIMVPRLHEERSSAPHTQSVSVSAGNQNDNNAHFSDEPGIIDLRPIVPYNPSSLEQGLSLPPPQRFLTGLGSILMHLPLYLLSAIKDLLLTFVDAVCAPWMGLDSNKLSFQQSVPTFYGGFSEEDSLRYIQTEACIGALFGFIHCFAWAFKFPTIVEQQLWRIMALSITVSPLMILMLAVIYRKCEGRGWKWTTDVAIAIVTILIYPLARLSTFVLTFSLLREVPAGALVEVQWSRFVPHV